jgi:hypothetical protein
MGMLGLGSDERLFEKPKAKTLNATQEEKSDIMKIYWGLYPFESVMGIYFH